MFEIPRSFRNNGEDYITVPVINAFLREQGIKTKYTDKREDLLQKIVDYGNQDYGE